MALQLVAVMTFCFVLATGALAMQGFVARADDLASRVTTSATPTGRP